MLAQLGSLLDVVLVPLNQVGNLIGLNAATAAVATGTDDRASSTFLFAITAAPFIEEAGPMTVALVNFLDYIVGFLQSLTDLL